MTWANILGFVARGPFIELVNTPETAQVGVISKAQKYSRNNYCEIFQLSHSAEKYPKGFSSPKLENSFSELETSEKN